MIKELIGAIGMTLINTGIPLNRADTATNTNYTHFSPISKSNVYNNDVIIDSELSINREIATIEFEETTESIFTYRQRAKINTIRNLESEEYYIHYYLLIEAKPTNITLNYTMFTLYSNPPESGAIVYNSSVIQFYKIQAPTTAQLTFLNGANYSNYAQLNSVDLTTGASLVEEEEFMESYDTSGQLESYYLFYLYIEYDSTLIQNNGTNLINNKNTVYSISETNNYTATITPTNYEVIDIPGLMFEILGMPFAWFSIAFNFTLFPGTPYAINISHLLLAILVSLIAIIIFRIIWKGRA